MSDSPSIKDWFFLSRDHWQDGWTYGDWRQYVARRPDGALQPCRVSGLPFFMAIIGLFCLFPAICGAIFELQGVDVYWGRVLWASVAGFLLTIPALILWFGPWTLMTAVAPRSYNGLRHF